jgi:hypothetical protein
VQFWICYTKSRSRRNKFCTAVVVKQTICCLSSRILTTLLHYRPSQPEQGEVAATAVPAESLAAVANGHIQRHGFWWGSTHAHHRANGGGSAGSHREQSNDFSHVDPEIMAQAKPLLTGNVVADRNIVRFYEARAQLLRRQQAYAL